MKKRILIAALVTAVSLGAANRARAATTVEAGIVICIGAMAVSAGAVALIQYCQPNYVLAYEEESDPRKFVCTCERVASLHIRDLHPCQGYFKKLSDCEALATIGNTNRAAIACGPIARGFGKKRVVLQASATPASDKAWREASSQNLDVDDNPRFAIVSNPEALTMADWSQLYGFSIVTNRANSAVFFRMMETDIP